MLYYARKKSNPEYKRCVKLFHFLKKGTFSTKKSERGINTIDAKVNIGIEKVAEWK